MINLGFFFCFECMHGTCTVQYSMHVCIDKQMLSSPLIFVAQTENRKYSFNF